MTNLLAHPNFGEIRIEKQGEEFLFCVSDVCEALELTHTTNAIQSLDDDEKMNVKILHSSKMREMLFVTESGLYTLIIRSNKPEARRFRKWITSEVLPSLRKYGFYSTDRKAMEKAELRYEQRTVRKLLSEMKSGLSDTDIRLAAAQCRTDKYAVLDVLDGRRKDPYMLAVLYARSNGNKLLRRDFYTREGAERLLAELRK